MSLTGSVVGGIAGDADGYAAYQRITNGGFASGSSWTINNAAWTIGAGVATSAGTGDGLVQTIGLVNSGRSVSVAFDVTAVTGTIAGFRVRWQMNGTLVQTDIVPITGVGAHSATITANAEFNQINLHAAVASTLAIDNVSVIA